MTGPDVPRLNIELELEALQATRKRRIAWLREANAEHRAARAVGLRARQSAKLARSRNQQATGDDRPGGEQP